jgi:hypothetical protein
MTLRLGKMIGTTKVGHDLAEQLSGRRGGGGGGFGGLGGGGFGGLDSGMATSRLLGSSDLIILH